MAITLQELLRGLFYAPFYVALAHDAYAAEGVAVRFVSAPEPGRAATAIMSGQADVNWGGPMRVMQTYHQDPGLRPREFRRSGDARSVPAGWAAPRPGFTLRDLAGTRLATVSEVPTPWMCLQEDLRRAGIAPGTIDRVAGATMADNCAALLAGSVDVVQLFEPFVSVLLAEHGCHLWYAQASRGPTSYTTFYARRPTLTRRGDELRRMVRAIYKTQRWVAGASGAEIAERGERVFSRYRAARFWRPPARVTRRWGFGGTIR